MVAKKKKTKCYSLTEGEKRIYEGLVLLCVLAAVPTATPWISDVAVPLDLIPRPLPVSLLHSTYPTVDMFPLLDGETYIGHHQMYRHPRIFDDSMNPDI